LVVIGLALAVTVALVVRNGFGVAFTAAVAVAALGIGVRGSTGTAQISLVFLATQLALSVFSRADYLFTDVAVTGGGTMPSDTAVIATALGGTYWLWGLACGAFSLAVLGAGVAWFLRVLSGPSQGLAGLGTRQGRPGAH
jgi:Peptidase M50B-like